MKLLITVCFAVLTIIMVTDLVPVAGELEAAQPMPMGGQGAQPSGGTTGHMGKREVSQEPRGKREARVEDRFQFADGGAGDAKGCCPCGTHSCCGSMCHG